MSGLASVSVSIAVAGALVAVVAECRAASRGSPRGLLAPLGLAPLAAFALAPLWTLALFVTTAGLVGRWSSSFDAGLWAGAVAMVVLAAGVLRGPRGADGGSAPSRADRASGGRAGFAHLGLVLILVGVGYANLAARYQMHDEHALFGHKSMVEQLRRGHYPPYAPPAPEVEGRYHYGFDLLAGALARAYGGSSDRAIDVVTVGLALLMSLGAAAVMVDLGAAAAAPFAALAVHLGAGLAALALAGVAGRHPRCLIQYHHPSCDVELFPTQLLNVFQHPVSLGVPFFLGLLLLAPRVLLGEGERDARTRAERLLVVLLPALALAQIAYFALGALALLAAAPFTREGGRWRRVGRLLCVLSIGLVLARALGGMFAPNPFIDSGLIAFRKSPGFPPNEGPLGILRHHAINLGLSFLLFPYFLARAFRTRQPQLLLLSAFAGGGIVAAHLFVYVRSWDIVKFPSAASFALTLLYAAIVDARLAGWPSPFRWARRFGQGLVMATGALAFAYLAFPLDPSVRPYELGTFRVDPIVQRVIDWFDAHPPVREELIYAQSNVAMELAVGGGLSVVGQDADLYYLGIRSDRLHEVERHAGQIRGRMAPEALAALRVGWVVVSDEEMVNLGADARAALEDSNRFEVVAEFAGENAKRRRRIFRVRGILSGGRLGA